MKHTTISWLLAVVLLLPVAAGAVSEEDFEAQLLKI